MSADLRELWEMVNRTWRKLIGQRAIETWKEKQMKEPLVPIVLKDLGRLQAGDVWDFSLTYPALWRVLRRERWLVQAGPYAVAGGKSYDWHMFQTEYKLRDVDLLALPAREIVETIMLARQTALGEVFGQIEPFLVATGLDLEQTGVITLRHWWLHEHLTVAPWGASVVLSSVLAFVPWAPPQEEAAVDGAIIVEGKG